jgi:ATP-dependent exoDNAse (exonuclease V) beta subunit
MAPALAAAGRRRLRDLVEATWTTLGGPACVDDQAMNDADDFLDSLSALEHGWTIALPERIEDGLARLFARPDPAADDRVQVMTMHQAKGLEFDVVILPELGRGVRERSAPLLTWREHEAGLLLAPLGADAAEPDLLYRLVQRLNVEATRHETGRVLYVAATRARCELHLFGHTDSAGRPRPGSLLADLWPSIGAVFATIPPPQDAALYPASPLALPPRLRRLPLTWTPPAAPTSLATTGTALAADHDTRISFRWAGETARHVGVVAHDLLARITREGLPSWSRERATSLRPAIGAALAGQGVPPHQLEDATTQAIAIVVTTLGTERGRWILTPHAEAASELELTGLVDSCVVRTRIDRTFVDDANVRWIVDFKTGVHQGGDVPAFLDHEQQRYQVEMSRYATLAAAIDAADGHDRPIRCGLYDPLIAGGWREWSHHADAPADPTPMR